MKLRVGRDNPALAGYRGGKIETVIDRAMRAAHEQPTSGGVLR